MTEQDILIRLLAKALTKYLESEDIYQKELDITQNPSIHSGKENEND